MPMTMPAQALPPRVGMLATVRNRRGIVSAVDAVGGATGDQLHLATIAYSDPDGPAEEFLVWEREVGASLLEPTALPDVAGTGPMPPEMFDALVRATRWSALLPFVDPDADGPLGPLPVAAPFHGAIQAEDYQLVPLLKALRMPRVALLLADDVGLGKTVQAGLILAELALRRRLRRVLVLCPASLRTQWRDEMLDKFALRFEIVDREATWRLRKQQGLDANPWRAFPRIIVSFDYLKQPDVLSEFIAACRVPEGSPHLPWDMLVLDEAHNLAPVGYGEDSHATRMLAALAPHFEHRLFLTATPHSGHTRSFTGLLELLDPVRFSRASELSSTVRERVPEVVVRRLKREINAQTSPPRFGNRELQALRLSFAPEERRLSAAFQDFRKTVRRQLHEARRAEQLAGGFAVEVLGKRLLSCPVAFADSWGRFRAGHLTHDDVSADEVQAAQRAAREDMDDDLEAEGRLGHAARTVGAWLRPHARALAGAIAAVEAALAELGLAVPESGLALGDPRHDARFDQLVGLVETYLRQGEGWRRDERLVVFTEYKTTLDYLERRLTERYGGDGAIRTLFGGMSGEDRETIKAAFNDPDDAVRILVATDAASEGLNLQQTARLLLHFDVPWNPARLDQRNGRLDRHGQARDVKVFHFVSGDDADLDFLGYVVGKVEQIREDLGSMGDVFDQAFQRRFLEDEDAAKLRRALEEASARAGNRVDLPRDAATATGDATGAAEAERQRALRAVLDLSAATLRDTLDAAMGLGVGRPRLEPADARGRCHLRHPLAPDWADLIDETLRPRTAGGAPGALPALLFDPRGLVEHQPGSGRPVFRPRRDTALLHLAHPLVERMLARFARERYPGVGTATRWTARRGPVPAGADALVLLTVEELAVNALRETFHHWVRTLRLPVRGGTLGPALAEAPAGLDAVDAGPPSPADIAAAVAVWDEVERAVREHLKARREALTAELRDALEAAGRAERRDALARFQSRQGELSALIEGQTVERLERELKAIESQRAQLPLWGEAGYLQELTRSAQAREDEIERRRRHGAELREQLDRERDRVLGHLLPRRHRLHGDAQVFPVAVEIRLPVGGV